MSTRSGTTPEVPRPDRGHPRSRRVALNDRPWVGYRSVMVAAPVRAPAPAALHAVLASYLQRHPDRPLACRIDERAQRWVPVPAAEREAHLARIVLAVADPEPDGIEAHIATLLPAAATDLPFVVVVSPRSICVIMSHAVGDAATLSRLLAALVRADYPRLAAIEPRAGSSAPLRALAAELRPHHREWIAHLRRPASTAPDGTVAAPATPDRPAPVARPAFAGRVITNPQMRELTRWRNANLPGVPLNSVLTAAFHRSFVDQGLSIRRDGYYSLFDIRSHLPKTDEPAYGNLAKSLLLTADLDDPRSIAAAMAEAQRSARAIPAIVAATAASALRRPAAPPPAAGGPMTLTMNAIPGLPGVADLPWSESASKRFYGFGLSTGADSITVFAFRMRDHMEVTVSFDESAAPAAAVRRGLAALLDAPVLTG